MDHGSGRLPVETGVFRPPERLIRLLVVMTAILFQPIEARAQFLQIATQLVFAHIFPQTELHSRAAGKVREC
jgi:hypothetical protein